eukprot:4994804-Pleurochrysis_carterae.AAC.1
MNLCDPHVVPPVVTIDLNLGTKNALGDETEVLCDFSALSVNIESKSIVLAQGQPYRRTSMQLLSSNQEVDIASLPAPARH